MYVIAGSLESISYKEHSSFGESSGIKKKKKNIPEASLKLLRAVFYDDKKKTEVVNGHLQTSLSIRWRVYHCILLFFLLWNACKNSVGYCVYDAYTYTIVHVKYTIFVGPILTKIYSDHCRQHDNVNKRILYTLTNHT